MKHTIIAVFLLLAFAISGSTADGWQKAAALDQKTGKESVRVKNVISSAERSVFVYQIPEGRIEQTEDGSHLLELGNAVQQVRTGEPIIPAVPMKFIIPAGRIIDKINVIGREQVDLPGTHTIEYGKRPYPLLPGAEVKPTAPDQAIYKSDNAFPKKRYSLVTVQKKYGIPVAVINLYPAVYHPLSGRLGYFSELEIEIITAPGEYGGICFPQRFNEKTAGIENGEALDAYSDYRDDPVALGICNPEDSYQYVLITSEEIRDAATDYTVNDLIAHRQSMGISATITTIEEILAEYPGVDDAERLRNFIIDAYTNWETEYVLLGGDINIIPMRKLYVDNSEEIPSDLYFQCLDGPFNGDGDSYWGETNDGENGGDVDLLAEVFIGRASAENPEEMANFIYKTLKYETDPEASAYLHSALMCGEYLGFGGDSEYAKPSMEEIRLGASTHGYTTVGFASAPSITVSTLYEQDVAWVKNDILDRINSDEFSIINHLGHANTDYVMMFYNPDADGLTNANPLFVYSQGCLPGNFEGNCVAEHLTTSTRSGCYGGVLNSRYGWGTYNSTDGPSQRFDRQFWDAYFDEYMFTLGEINADSHEDNLWDIGGGRIRWCYVETNLFCDPLTRMRGMVMGPMVSYASHQLDDNAGNGNGIAEPGEALELPVSLLNNGSDPASGVSAQLSTTDAYVTITADNASYGDIACCGTVASSPDRFAVTVASDCPTPHTVQLTLSITDNAANTWESSFSFTVNSVSLISGHVQSFTGTNPVVDASVFYSGPMNGSVLTDADGAYSISVIDGTYLLHAEADDYLASASVSVTTPPGSAVDFFLYRPVITVAPTAVNEVLAPGSTMSLDLQITNSGDTDLTYAIRTVDGAAASIIRPEEMYDSTHFLPIAKGAEDTRIGQPVNLGSGGPDLFGYRWIDSDEPGGPAYEWTDISSTGSVLSAVSGCDDCSQAQALSFQFPFYGTEFNQIYVSSNGYITLGNGYSQYTNTPIPSTSCPPNLIAGFWDDLYPGHGGTIYFQDFGDHAVVQFNEVSPYSGSGTFTYQMVLETDGTITFYYENMNGSVTSSTVGIQNSTQDDGLQVVYNAAYISNGLAVRISPVPEWFYVAPESGTCPAGDVQTVTLTLDATTLSECTKNGRLLIDHNDPVAVQPLEIPVTLTVTSVIPPPEITEQPVSVTVPEGATAQFSVTAVGTALHYQWSRNGTDIPGATLPTYTTDPLTLADNGAQFVCEVRNPAGSVTSDPATLTVVQVQPVIVTQPQSQMVDNGSSVEFSVEATGSELQYQWRRDGTDITGATSPEFTIASVNMHDNGAVFTCLVSNPAGSVESDPALLTVVPTNNYQLQLISIGNSTAATAGSSGYTARDVTVGSNASGVVEGTRFRLFLK